MVAMYPVAGSGSPNVLRHCADALTAGVLDPGEVTTKEG